MENPPAAIPVIRDPDESLNLEIRKIKLDENARFIRNEEVDNIARQLRVQDKSAMHPLIIHAIPNVDYNPDLGESDENPREIFDLLNGHHRVMAAQKVAKPTWPCLIYRHLTAVEIAWLKMNNEVSTSSSDPEKMFLIHDAIIDHAYTHQHDDGDWISKQFLQKIKTSRIVERLVPPIKNDRTTDNWQNSWISLSCFGFRKPPKPFTPGRKYPDPKPASKYFTSEAILRNMLMIELTELQVEQEALSTLMQKRSLSIQFLNLFLKRSSKAITFNKEPTVKILTTLCNDFMRVRRVTRIQEIIRHLSHFVFELEALAADSEAEEDKAAERDVKDRISKYMTSLTTTITLSDWLVEELQEGDHGNWGRERHNLIKNILIWSPLDFWSFFFGPLQNSPLWGSHVEFQPLANLNQFQHNSGIGSVAHPSNADMRLKIKSKIFAPNVNVENLGAKVLEYLGYIFRNTQIMLVEELADFQYIVYSKDYRELGHVPTYEGFQEEVSRSCLNPETPKAFGFIKSHSNLNW